MVFLRDAAAGVGNTDQNLFRLLRNSNLHRAARTVVLDCIFRQVKKQSVNQCITADEEAVSLHLQRNIALFCQKREICEDLLNHRGKLNLLVSRHLLQITHFKQRFGHLCQPLRLFPQKCKKLRRFRQHIGMLRGEQLQLCLHQCQRRAQFVGSVAGELPLGGKGVVQPLQHLIERVTQLPKLRQNILVNPHIRQVVQLHLLHLRHKAAQRLEGASADKIGQNAAKQCHHSRNIPVGHAKAPLRSVDNNGQILIGRYELRIKALCAFTVHHNRVASL